MLKLENWRFPTIASISMHSDVSFCSSFIFFVLFVRWWCVCLLGYLFARGKKSIFYVYTMKLIKICGAVKLFERFQPGIYTYVQRILWSLVFSLHSPHFSYSLRTSIDKTVFILTFNISYLLRLLYLPVQCNGEENIFSHFLFGAYLYVLCMCVVTLSFSFSHNEHHTFFPFQWICQIVMHFHGNRMFDLVFFSPANLVHFSHIWPLCSRFSFPLFFIRYNMLLFQQFDSHQSISCL